MKGAGILLSDTDLSTVALCDDCLWKIEDGNAVSADPTIKQNPLGYRCAPNEATPDYVCSPSIEKFIAYAFQLCYDDLHPDYFSMWNMVRREDVKWLRENFLRILEKLVLNVYAGKVTPESNPEDFDHGDWCESLNIGNHDREPEDGEPDEEELEYRWCPGPADKNGFSMDLDWSMVYGEGGGDSETIWLAWDAILDRSPLEVLEAINKAAEVNALDCCPPVPVEAASRSWKEAIEKWQREHPDADE